MPKRVVIDQGHGGNDPGSVWLDDSKEKEFTLALSLAVRDALTAGWEIEAILTRTADVPVGLGDRAAMANEPGLIYS